MSPERWFPLSDLGENNQRYHRGLRTRDVLCHVCHVERLLGGVMAGNGTQFVREESVGAAWAVVDPVLVNHHPCCPYKPGSWGPKEADMIIAGNGSWHNPTPMEASS